MRELMPGPNQMARMRVQSGTVRILITSENDDLALHTLQCLNLAGLNALVATPDVRRSRCRLSRACLGVIELPENLTRREAIGFFRTQAVQLGVTHVVPADITQTRLLAAIHSQIAPIVSFPLSDSKTISDMDDKSRFAELLQQLGLPGPRFTLLRSRADADHHSLGEDVVVKPLLSEGGKGVRRCRMTTELKAALAGTPTFPAQPLLLQEYIPGEDIDLTVLADHGRITHWTIHQRSGVGPGGENGSLIFVDNDEVLRLGWKLIAATGFHGLAHIDMRKDYRDGTIKFIEVNPRVYGSIHFAAYAGVNFVALGLELAADSRMLTETRQICGAVHPPSTLLRLLFCNKEKLQLFNLATFRALRQAVCDPLPRIASVLQRCGNQMPRNPWKRHGRPQQVAQRL